VALKAASGEVAVIYQVADAELPDGDVIVVAPAKDEGGEAWKPATAENFRIRPMEPAVRNGMVVEGKTPGLIYGVFKLAEQVRLGRSLWKVKLESMPGFPMRFYTEFLQVYIQMYEFQYPPKMADLYQISSFTHPDMEKIIVSVHGVRSPSVTR